MTKHYVLTQEEMDSLQNKLRIVTNITYGLYSHCTNHLNEKDFGISKLDSDKFYRDIEALHDTVLFIKDDML